MFTLQVLLYLVEKKIATFNLLRLYIFLLQYSYHLLYLFELFYVFFCYCVLGY